MNDKPHYRAWFRSIANSQETYPLDEIVYTSRDGDLLEVHHDLDELKKTSAAQWKALFIKIADAGYVVGNEVLRVTEVNKCRQQLFAIGFWQLPLFIVK